LYLSECQHLSVLIFIEFGSQTNAHFFIGTIISGC
jgi:hypothetical protein